jgi:hypothetical protein
LTVALAALALLAAWAAVRPLPRGTPRSGIHGHFYVGRDFFERRGLAAPGVRTGLVEHTADLAYPGFDAAALPEPVRDFLERTARLDLHVTPAWQPGFRWLSRAVGWPMRRIGQFDLPQAPAVILTRVLALDPSRDRRPGLRGVVRTYAEGGRPMQVAAYGFHALHDVAYMNCAFILPGGHLAGLLRLEPRPGRSGATGAALTTRRTPGGPAGPGIWYVTRWLALPLPLSETLMFWPRGEQPFALDEAPGFEAAHLVGQHELRVFGRCFLRNQYLFRWSALP